MYLPDFQVKGASGRGPRIDWQRAVEWRRLYLDDHLSMGQIGEKYGVSRQRVEQVLKRAGAVTTDDLAARRARFEALTQYEERRLLYETVMEAMARATECLVCSAWILRFAGRGRPRKTCSPACARLWAEGARFALEDEYNKHRFYQARSILRHPGNNSASKIAWAERMLSDEPPPPNRRFSHPGSRLSEAKARVTNERAS